MDSLRSTQEMEQLSQRLNNIDVSMSPEVKSIHVNNTHEVLPGNHTGKSNNDQGKNSRRVEICQAWLRRLCKYDGNSCKSFHDDIALRVPGCYLCYKYDQYWDSNCKFCTREFCRKGTRCGNVYSSFGSHMRYYKSIKEYVEQVKIKKRGPIGQGRSLENGRCGIRTVHLSQQNTKSLKRKKYLFQGNGSKKRKITDLLYSIFSKKV